jgi:uncharacterized protein with PQ loop repeat
MCFSAVVLEAAVVVWHISSIWRRESHNETAVTMPVIVTNSSECGDEFIVL